MMQKKKRKRFKCNVLRSDKTNLICLYAIGNRMYVHRHPKTHDTQKDNNNKSIIDQQERSFSDMNSTS